MHGAHCTGGWLGSSASLQDCEKEKNLLPPVRVQTPSHPACSEWLYWLCYPWF